MSSKHILITGGTGFLGQALIRHWLAAGHQISVLTRDPVACTQLLGDKVTAISNLNLLPASSHLDAIVNLAGSPIFSGRWTAQRKQQIRSSRIGLTGQLFEFLQQRSQKPAVLISGSAIGIYGNRADKPLTESTPIISGDFAQQLCDDWEHSALRCRELGIRVCLIRTGLVLDHDGGLLQRMLPGFKLGLGGRLGSGKQWMSWIHRHDWVAIADRLLNDDSLEGAFNATAPQPVDNQTFSRKLASHLHRPCWLNLPAPLLKSLLGEMAALVLGSQRVLPARMLDAGFQFRYSDLDTALQQILHRD